MDGSVKMYQIKSKTTNSYAAALSGKVNGRNINHTHSKAVVIVILRNYEIQVAQTDNSTSTHLQNFTQHRN